MDTAGYIVLSRQSALFRQMEIVANNIANANTDGFKSEAVIFAEHLSGKGDNVASFASDVAVSRNLESGKMRHTGRDLDVAIQGDGYFEVATPLGTRYTRRGTFSLNAEGSLITPEGYEVQGAGGAIAIEETDGRLIIREDGTIAALNNLGQQEERGTLKVVKFDNERMLKKLPNAMYTALDDMPSQQATEEDFSIAQGMLEGSNVDSTYELTRMIEISRAVGTTSGMMNNMHELQRKAITTISKQQ